MGQSVGSVLSQFDYCRVCGTFCADGNIRDWARRQYQRMTCSVTCTQADVKRRFACCELAEPIGCVCTYAFRCAEHGERHIGTHD